MQIDWLNKGHIEYHTCTLRWINPYTIICYDSTSCWRYFKLKEKEESLEVSIVTYIDYKEIYKYHKVTKWYSKLQCEDAIHVHPTTGNNIL